MTTNHELTTLREPAPAKINLLLHIDGRRDDGLHNLESLVVFTAFGDVVHLSPSPTMTLARAGLFAGQLPDDPQNDLCLRAATQLADVFGIEGGVRISLEKNIPVAAGIGGGSSDAAAVLRGLCRLWNLDRADTRVRQVAEGLGADVPVCLHGGAAFVSGIGDIVTPLARDPGYHLLLVNPNKALSTAAVFGALDGGAGFVNGLAGAVLSSESGALLQTIISGRNDLSDAARRLCPVIDGVLRSVGQSADCMLARMSGSGATCFGMFPDPESCQRAGAEVSKAHPEWWVCPTRTSAVR